MSAYIETMETAGFRQRIVATAAAGGTLCLRGGGSKSWYGEAPRGTLLDTRGHSGIVAYAPSELVLTARCGTTLAEIEETLAAHGQMLAFEPPHGGPGATLGGMLAAGLSGPRRQGGGALRDHVLGVLLMDGRGQALRFGGQVMKNVAGYDVARLLAGSLGILGVILEASLKVAPRPRAEATLCFEMAQQQALAQLNAWGGQPLPLSASAWHAGQLYLRLSGAEAAVAAARARLGGTLLEGGIGDRFWEALREQRLPFFAGEAPLWRLTLPSATTPLPLSCPQLIEWGGAQRWLRATSDTLPEPAQLRELAASLGGHASLHRHGAGAAGCGVFHPLPPALLTIHRRLKREFDPTGIFNPGRMYPEL